jgi:hypothetical protein
MSPETIKCTPSLCLPQVQLRDLPRHRGLVRRQRLGHSFVISAGSAFIGLRWQVPKASQFKHFPSPRWSSATRVVRSDLLIVDDLLLRTSAYLKLCALVLRQCVSCDGRDTDDSRPLANGIGYQAKTAPLARRRFEMKLPWLTLPKGRSSPSLRLNSFSYPLRTPDTYRARAQ